VNRVIRLLLPLTCSVAGLLAQPPAAPGQELTPRRLTLSQAIDAALRSYPSIHVSQEQMNAAAAGIRLAQTAYLPRVDGLAQINRTTRNNVFGLLLPQSIIPNISGPVLGTNSLGSVWGSATGVLVSWQPFDFGLRHANVTTAAAARERTQATLNRTRFEVSVATADAFLTVIAARQTVAAAQAAVDSWEILRRSIHALVESQLRPGADESRVEAELAAARTQLAQAEQATDVARSTLAQFVGLDASQLDLTQGRLLDRLPPDQSIPAINAAVNPASLEQRAAVDEAQSQLKALQRTYVPQFSLQGSAYARGTGAEIDGRRLGGWNGLSPNFQNYALGFSISFAFMDLPSIHAKEAAQSATIRARQAQYDLVKTNLQAQSSAAKAALNGARRVAANTPVEVSSARTALAQAKARYQAGLAPIDDVAQAQRLLVQAQIDDALGRLSVWRALLQLETVGGDIQSFAAEASQ
jgi:outer membrane protein